MNHLTTRKSRTNLFKKLINLHRGQIFILSLFLVILPCTPNSYCSSQALDFIYIDSSVDEAAGGHTAIRLGQTVFHFQYYDDGHFLLVKDDWDEFRYQYNDLQNRTIAIASLPLSVDTYHNIKTRFITRYLLQKKRFAYLDQLKSEKEYFQKLSMGKGVISVKGLGFFSQDTANDTFALSLKEYIGRELGTSFLENLYNKISGQLAEAQQNLHPHFVEMAKLDLYTPGLSFPSEMNYYFELIELQQAVTTLLSCSPVLEEVLYQTEEPTGILSRIELGKLHDYRNRIRLSIVHLLESSRPGRGKALLLQAARFQALGLSIEKEALITLDPFSSEAERIQGESLLLTLVAAPNLTPYSTKKQVTKQNILPLSHRTYFDQLRYERQRDAVNAKNNFFSTKDNLDIAYNQLESSLGRLWEIERAQHKKNSFRLEGGVLLPSKSLLVQDEHYMKKEELIQFIENSETNIALLEKQLLEVYSYNLFDKNCVTELFETVYSCFSNSEQAEKKLGGYLVPGEYLTFVPFKSFSRVQDLFPSATIKIAPSFRKRQLKEVYAQNGSWSFLEESNTLTSTIYYPWEKDSTFLFFTDDSLLLRPVLGTLNLLYAALGSIGGIFTFPIDEGRLLSRSVRGMVFSLPELAFINIRKGTFPAVALEESQKALLSVKRVPR